GLQIIAPAGEAGRPSPQVPALSGTMDTREALARLIANTGLEGAADDGQTVTLYPPPVLASLAAAPAPRPQDPTPAPEPPPPPRRARPRAPRQRRPRRHRRRPRSTRSPWSAARSAARPRPRSCRW